MYYIIEKKTASDNDYRPNILLEDIEKDNICNTRHLKVIILRRSRQVMNRTNQSLVLLYCKSNKHLWPEKFAYHLLLLFYPFVNESDLFSKIGPTRFFNKQLGC